MKVILLILCMFLMSSSCKKSDIWVKKNTVLDTARLKETTLTPEELRAKRAGYKNMY